MILQVYITVNHQNQQKQSKNIAIYPQKFLIWLTFLLWLGKMKVFYIDFTFKKLKELYMKKLSLPPTERRRLTRNQIYQYIYKAPGCSKQEIADSLNFSMPTVHQNLNELTQAGLVRIDEFLSPTIIFGSLLRTSGWMKSHIKSILIPIATT